MVDTNSTWRNNGRNRQTEGTFPSKTNHSKKFEDKNDDEAFNKNANFNVTKPFRSPADQRADAVMKSWRLIIRNLSFKTTKEDLQNAFSKFGPFQEIVLPKCKDPRYPNSCAGFGFVQYKGQEAANAARNSLNMTDLNGRKVAVDWAIPKDTYDTAVHEEKTQSAGASNKPSKATKFDDEDEGIEEGKDDADGSGSDEDDDAEEDDDEDQEEDEDALREQEARKRARNEKPEKAVEEGRALFVRNLSFDTESDGLKARLEEFGKIELAVICKYPGTDHSKGSAFVYFGQREEADKCLAETETEEGVSLDGRRIYAHRALPRNEASDMEKAKQLKNPKDNRNLHLLRVGIIRPGTTQAKNMSEADAKKRANLELAARNKIKNLHMFVSPTRLVVHNLPPSVTDKRLKSICFLASNDVDAKIIECRIWRDRARVTTEGEGKSRGFGFVAFSEHRHALACLQALNNNPQTFTDVKRPIVEFSIENMSALNIKRSRVEKSKQPMGAKRHTTATTAVGPIAAKRAKTDLDATKREIAAGGRKAFASHVGPKIRHRDKGKKAKRGDAPAPAGKKPKASASNKKSRKVVREEKAGRKSTSHAGSKRKMTKFLALS